MDHIHNNRIKSKSGISQFLVSFGAFVLLIMSKHFIVLLFVKPPI